MDRRKAFSQKVIRIPREYGEDVKLDVEFVFKSTHVVSIDSNSFQMTTITDIEGYDGSLEASRYARSEQLACLGIICFFTNIPLTVYDVETGKDEVQELSNIQEIIEVDSRFIFNGENETNDLIIILEQMISDMELTVTIIDRIRKGLYLEKISNDANLHHDEVFLIYFGIIELLSDKFARELKNKLDESMESKLYNFYSENLFYNEIKRDEIVRLKLKLVKEIIIREELRLKNKILFMCKKLNINHIFLDDFVGELIKQRNKVAHGRTIYNDKVIWPLPPFFSSIDDSPAKLDSVFYFMTNIVQSYYNLRAFEESYKGFKKLVLPSKEFVKGLLKDPQKYSFSKRELIDGNDYNFTYETIFYLFVHRFSNISIDEFVNIIGDSYCGTEINENNGPVLFNLSILFADSLNGEVQVKARDNIEKIVENSWYFWSNIKDVIRYLNYYDVKNSWFEEWIRNGGHISCR